MKRLLVVVVLVGMIGMIGCVDTIYTKKVVVEKAPDGEIQKIVVTEEAVQRWNDDRLQFKYLRNH